MKHNKFIVLVLIFALMTLNISSVFANTDTTTGDSVEVSEDNPERVIDFEIKTTIDGVINISYVDKENKSIAPGKTEKVNDGTFTYKAIEVPGYVATGETEKKVTISKDGQEENISFSYRKAVGIVNVSYVDGNKELTARDSFSVELGTYEYKAKAIDGYKLSSPGTQSATITKDGQAINVVFEYDIIPVVTPTPEPQPEPEPIILTGVIKGFLKTVTGEPITNTRLELHSDPLVAFTDDNGYFEFKEVSLGKHKLYLADDNYSKELIELKSLTVKENEIVKAEITGEQLVSMAQETGLVETAELEITDNSLEKEIELVVAPKVKGTIIVKYMLNGELLDQEEMDNLDMGIHKVSAKEFDEYVLVSTPDSKDVELTEDTPNQTVVVEFTYEPVPVPVVTETPDPEPTPLPIIPIALVVSSFFFAIVIIFVRKQIVVYAVDSSNGKETLRRLRKKRVKLTKDGVKVNLQREILLANGSKIKVVFLKNIARKIGGKQITFYNGNSTIERAVAPVKLNKEFEVFISSQNTTESTKHNIS